MPPRPRKKGVARKRSRQEIDGGSTSDMLAYDASRFTCVENQEWYDLRASNTVLAEVDLEPNFDSQYKFHQLFETMGWGCMLSLPRLYYPTLVRQFYANVSNKTTISSVYKESYVKGVPIHLSRETLATILGAMDEGPVFEHGKYLVQGDPTWQFEMTLPKYSSRWASFKTIADPVTGEVRMESAPIPTKSLQLRHSLLVYLFNHNILPASSSKNEVRVMDVYMLDKLENGLGGISRILLSTIILGAMSRTAAFKGVKKALPYARVLTHFFEHFGIDLTGEPYTIASEIVNHATIKRIAYHNEQDPGENDDGDDEDVVHSDHEAGTSQSISRPTVRELLQTVLSEVQGTRAMVDALAGRVTAMDGRLSTMADELSALRAFHSASS